VQGQHHCPAPLLPAELLGQEVKLAPDCVGDEVQQMKAGLQNGQVLLLENVRCGAASGAADEHSVSRSTAEVRMCAQILRQALPADDHGP
jgi:3-phosphoglycerate kinase